MDVRDNRWRAAKHPSDILPCNRTAAQIKKFFSDREASRKRTSRKKAGARPQHLSDVKLAKRHGRDRETIAEWRKLGIIDPETGDLTGKPLPKRGRKPGRNTPQIRPAAYKDEESLLFDDVRKAGGRNCGVEGQDPADAAPRAPLPKEDATDMTNDAPADAEDATRPAAAPGDARPDDADAMPERSEPASTGPWAAPCGPGEVRRAAC
jgi:hypothetical protein